MKTVLALPSTRVIGQVDSCRFEYIPVKKMHWVGFTVSQAVKVTLDNVSRKLKFLIEGDQRGRFVLIDFTSIDETYRMSSLQLPTSIKSKTQGPLSTIIIRNDLIGIYGIR